MAGHDSERWVEHTESVLRDAGLRASAGRTAVVEVLGRQACLVSAQDIADRLRAEGRPGSTATVYRALETLHELGLVRRFDSGAGSTTRYEPVDPSGHHHHHLVLGDGEVVPFEDALLEEALESLGERLGERLGLDVTGHEIIFWARRSNNENESH